MRVRYDTFSFSFLYHQHENLFIVIIISSSHISISNVFRNEEGEDDANEIRFNSSGCLINKRKSEKKNFSRLHLRHQLVRLLAHRQTASQHSHSFTFKHTQTQGIIN